jgi:hypothetical protein
VLHITFFMHCPHFRLLAYLGRRVVRQVVSPVWMD